MCNISEMGKALKNLQIFSSLNLTFFILLNQHKILHIYFSTLLQLVPFFKVYFITQQYFQPQ